MNILITGANGFVGCFLSTKLAESGFNVIAVTRTSSEFSSEIKHIIKPKINDQTSWHDALTGCDVVIHLAARVHVMNEQSNNPLQAFLDVNLHGTINLAKQAIAAGVKRFVYVSSIKVNGEYTEGTGFTERDIPNPKDSYAVSKWRAEEALLELSKTTGMEVVIIRPTLVYGAGVKANFLRLLEVINKSLPLPLANINNQRSMIYIGNLVDALMACATHPNAANQTYLVSDDESVSTPVLIRLLAKSLGKRCFVFPFPIFIMKFLAGLLGKSAAVDRLTQSLVIDSSKIRRELGWVPPYSLQQGLDKTVGKVRDPESSSG